MGDVIDLRTNGFAEDADPGVAADPADLADQLESRGLGAPSLGAALEALLLLADEPTPAVTLAGITGCLEVDVEATLAELAMRYLAEERGIELRRVDAGWRFYTAASCRELVTRYVTDGRQARLSQPALETLAIVAYRQPVTRAQVGAVRGVNSDGVLKTLATRGLIAEVAGDHESHAAHFVTTPYFLDRMGLASLAELPPIAEHLPDYGSLDELVE